ncbi:unnamed protein product [Notodromas monacha]|uniref:Uncharacterized protein n=1 Tax=Notodromas monacha TaxID=399045 RepID=A0A7R9BFT6_9CRUS|nr:unnamed protein product [Notodromas monacha]CAG0914653.1 unnamed protein product [Notodromas monacha]
MPNLDMIDPYQCPNYQSVTSPQQQFHVDDVSSPLDSTTTASTTYDDDGVPCRERPPPTHIISKLYVIYQRYKFVILATTFSAFLGIFFSGLLFTTATEGRVKTCFGPDCGDMKEAELQGKIVAVGHPAEVLQKLHYPEPPGSKPPEAKGYDRSQPWDMVKLPSFARPRHYKLLLQPDVDRQAFREFLQFNQFAI